MTRAQPTLLCRTHLLAWLAGLLALVAAPGTRAETVEDLLTLEEAPPGVVFEIVCGDPGLLAEAIPKLRSDIAALRARFPGLPIVVMSHGKEQFALTHANARNNPELHAQAQDLVSDDVTLQVCGTYASWHGMGPESFPNYVDVAASGPAQINDYRALDYVVIRRP